MSHHLDRIPERAHLTASQLESQIGEGEPYVTYVKVAGEALSSLYHALSESQFHKADNLLECSELYDLAETMIPNLYRDNRMSISIHDGLIEQRKRFENRFSEAFVKELQLFRFTRG